jgi:hypothetical protein
MANRVISNHQKNLKEMGLLPWKLKKYLSWRQRMLVYTKKDPLRCPVCNSDMDFVDIGFTKIIDYPRILLHYETSLQG